MYATMVRAGAQAPDGATEEFGLRQLGGPRDLVLRLHDGDGRGPDDFEIEAEMPFAEPGTQAKVASVVTFSGPLSEAVKAASDRAGRERIGPAMQSRSEAVRVLRLWQPERRSQVIVVFAADQAVLEEGSRQIATMALLPDEDPALLPGPDHVEMFEVRS